MTITAKPFSSHIRRVAALALFALGSATSIFAAETDKLPAPPSCSLASGAPGAHFPQAALDAKIQRGSATVSFLVSPSGRIHDVKLDSVSDPVFAEEALAAVSQLRCVNPADMEMPTHFTIGFRIKPD